MDAYPTSRRLMWHDAFLFLLGLLTGMIVPRFTNPRMGVSAHLEFVVALYGTYANWGSTLLAAVFGTTMMTPIAGEGYSAPVWQEMIIGFGLVSLSVAMLICGVLVLWGLRKPSAG